jgi:hypothetical protein
MGTQRGFDIKARKGSEIGGQVGLFDKGRIVNYCKDSTKK